VFKGYLDIEYINDKTRKLYEVEWRWYTGFFRENSKILLYLKDKKNWWIETS